MSYFEVEEFGYYAGDFDQLVFNAKKFTKEDAVNYFNKNYDYKGIKADVSNVSDAYVKYYINANEYMDSESEGGVYGFTDKMGRGAFPVYVITLSELDEVMK